MFLVDNFDRAIFTPDGDDRIAFGTPLRMLIESVVIYVCRRYLVRV